MNSVFDSHRQHLVSVLVSTSIFWVFSCCPTIAQAQQLGPNKAKVAIVHFFGVGPAFGDLEYSSSIVDHPEYGSDWRNWHFHPGYTFTARFLLWQSHFVKNVNNRLMTIGLLVGGDFSLLPMRANRIESSDGSFVDVSNNKLIESNVFLTPGVVVRPRKVPIQLLLMAGVNYRISKESSLSGTQLENGFGTSWIAMVRFHSIWSGISVHRGRSRNIHKSMFWPYGPDWSEDISCTTVRLSIGFNGWLSEQ